jgi:hypothetical protein
MTRTLNSILNETITTLGGTDTEKAMLVGYLENQVASVTGQIDGFRSNADNSTRQADELEPYRDQLVAMLNKFTEEVVSE